MIPILYLHGRSELGGGEISLQLLWEHLDRRRYRPLFLGPADGPLADRARLLEVETCRGDFPRLRDALGPRGWLRMARLTRQARRLAPRILHGNSTTTNLAAAWIGARLGSRVVWHERTLLRPRERDVDRWCAALPHRIICNSAAVAQRFRRAGERAVVIRNGVPLDRFAPGRGGEAVRREGGLGPGDVAVGIVGNFSPLKNHDLFFQAAALVAPDMPQTRFWIVGAEIFPENQGRQALLRVAAARLGLEDRARFLGQRNDMPAIMDALDLLVAAAEAEACSRAVLEAMAAGTPVVAADAGGNPELVVHGETGLLFAPRDAQALAAALRILIRDAEARRRLGRAARARVEEQFSIQRQVREIEAVYEAVLSGA